jgi:hypothetical protein
MLFMNMLKIQEGAFGSVNQEREPQESDISLEEIESGLEILSSKGESILDEKSTEELSSVEHAALRQVRRVQVLKQREGAMKRIRWIAQGAFPGLKDSITKEQIAIKPGYAKITLTAEQVDLMKRNGISPHGMAFRSEGSNPWSKYVIAVNGESEYGPEKIEKHEVMHLLYREGMDERHDEPRGMGYLWSACKSEMLAYLVGNDFLQLKASRLIPFGMTIEEILEHESDEVFDTWANRWNNFVQKYHSVQDNPDVKKDVLNAALQANTFEEFFIIVDV